MPYGILINSCAVLSGGLIGAACKRFFPERLKTALPNMFGLSALMMGITLMVQLSSLSAAVMSVIVGAAIGELLRLEDGLQNGLHKLESKIKMDETQLDTLISLIILFCFSGTGVFGAMNSAITGDHSVLYAKSIMDFFTAIIFATTAGVLVSLISIPQLAVGLILFFAADFVMPFVTAPMLSNFKAVGGLITFAVGLKIAGIKRINVLNILPGLLIVFPVSAVLQ